MTKICITGATGFLGGYLVELFKKKDFEVVAFGRNELAGRRLCETHVSFVKGNLENEDHVLNAIQGCDYVVHAGALSSAWGPYEDFYHANVLGTLNVLKACTSQGVKRLVFISSPSIYTEKKHCLNIKEEDVDRANHLTSYIQTKLMAEKVIGQWSQGDFEKVIIRPRGLFGIGDTSVIPRLMRANEKRGLPLFNDGLNLVDVTCVENVAHSIYLAVRVKGIDGGIYNITNGQAMTFKSIMEKFLASINEEAKFIPVKFGQLYWLVAVMETLYKCLSIKQEPVFTKYTLMTLGFSQTLNIDKARTELGYEPIMTIEEGIESYGNWYREHH